jgi:FecR protein
MNRARGLLFAAALSSSVFQISQTAWAAGQLESAEVTRVYNRVELLPPEESAIPAKIGDDINGRTAVQTGGQSRAELKFNDQTLARLGANSVFSFERGTRDLNLSEGVILLEVPKNAGGATINTAAVTAAVTGTTVMVQYQKGATPKEDAMKFIVLEGKMKLKLKGRFGKTIVLGPGETISMRAGDKNFPPISQIDIQRLSETSGLMGREFSPLRNEPYIVQTMDQQRILKSKGKLLTVDFSQKKNPVLQVLNTANQSSLRTDAAPDISRSTPRTVRNASRPNSPNRVVNKPPVKPPVPPKKNPPKPPKQPPRPKPQPPVQPPVVPPPPNDL